MHVYANAKVLLMKEKAEIEQRLQNTDQYGLTEAMNESIGELSGYDQHPADIATELFERAKDIALREHDELRLDAVKHALEKFQEGTYGICEHCGQAIEETRILAEPAATLCITCAKETSQPVNVHDRPVEEEYLSPGFGRTNLDDQDYTGFDGEDSWQALARMNSRHDPDSVIDEELYAEGSGYVDPIEQISNMEYKAQLPD
ncbi:TraR/DksA C4-type zinc finger protein [Sulfoacidibacillus thermotolerans]|uniref:Zinc finger DksA/TraR C4-type domain-containing protein n=1 Tax=Sulfoacidibacillus thermotolerans TaxID=1765684 RepID=A0A2U3D7Q1_SULT2|nr:TraR/DksA C4-type zinc finger protein [Sulfoacidibacillus thermotolerans]PWI57320.1 hypothetical protein BM613_08935 [Sulfoacidibacillus thermotolerans]